MIIDSSAIVAILRGEVEAADFGRLIEGASEVAVSAATVLESSIVLGAVGQDHLDAWLLSAGATVAAMDGTQLKVARRAYLEYGKGSGSRARLNFGDCFSYALAKTTGRPLLFKGDDFGHTDIEAAWAG